MSDALTKLRDRLRAFAAARDWDQFHTPKNLSMALIAEAAELVEHFQWLTPEQSLELNDEKRVAVAHELADILIYLVRTADRLNIDLLTAADEKMRINEQRYPAARVRGDARRASEYESR
jgi:NTP pyrophosphatase (non-canonical NTP hydrolase)